MMSRHEREDLAGPVRGRPRWKTTLATAVVLTGFGLAPLPAFAGFAPVRPTGGGAEVRCLFDGQSVGAGEKIVVVETSGKKVTLGCRITGGAFLLSEPNGRPMGKEVSQAELEKLEKESKEVIKEEEEHKP
jgi:hypothetical protein